jgi:hypothetical protein
MNRILSTLKRTKDRIQQEAREYELSYGEPPGGARNVLAFLKMAQDAVSRGDLRKGLQLVEKAEAKFDSIPQLSGGANFMALRSRLLKEIASQEGTTTRDVIRSLRASVIRLAYTRKDLRPYLLRILTD